MNRSRAFLFSGLFLILITSLPGLWGGSRDIRQAITLLQKLTAVGDLVYGACGVTILILAWKWPTHAKALLIGWAVVMTLTAGLAPIAWGQAPVAAGFLSGAAAALIAFLVIWLVRRGLRAANP